MDVWKSYEGRKVFIILKSKRHYSGIVNSVTQSGDLTFINISDKFNHLITFVSSEIEVIQEEE